MGVPASTAPIPRVLRSEPGAVGEARHLRVVAAQDRTPSRRRRQARALAGAGLVLAVAFGLVYLHVVLAQRQFALDRLTAKVQAEQTEYQNLRLRVAQLESPPQVIATAEGQLGMRQPASVNYLAPSVTFGATPGSASTSASGAPPTAPAGDADWPQIKAQLAGSP
jgi:cell division protein FtsL